MNITKNLRWMLRFDDNGLDCVAYDQPLCNAERPSYHNDIRISWNPLHIEIPTKMLPETREWIDNCGRFPQAMNMQIILMDDEDNELEKWDIENAMIHSMDTQKSRNSNTDVVHVVPKYSRAQRT
jgi:hypothetical protein